jgi:hypothetical protein
MQFQVQCDQEASGTDILHRFRQHTSITSWRFASVDRYEIRHDINAIDCDAYFFGECGTQTSSHCQVASSIQVHPQPGKVEETAEEITSS